MAVDTFLQIARPYPVPGYSSPCVQPLIIRSLGSIALDAYAVVGYGKGFVPSPPRDVDTRRLLFL